MFDDDCSFCEIRVLNALKIGFDCGDMLDVRLTTLLLDGTSNPNATFGLLVAWPSPLAMFEIDGVSAKRGASPIGFAKIPFASLFKSRSWGEPKFNGPLTAPEFTISR